MKKFKLTPSIFIWLFGFCVLVSCSNDNDDVNIQTENDLQSASWQITKFIDSDVDETQNFNGYNFNFAGNGASPMTMWVASITTTIGRNSMPTWCRPTTSPATRITNRPPA